MPTPVFMIQVWTHLINLNARLHTLWKNYKFKCHEPDHKTVCMDDSLISSKRWLKLWVSWEEAFNSQLCENWGSHSPSPTSIMWIFPKQSTPLLKFINNCNNLPKTTIGSRRVFLMGKKTPIELQNIIFPLNQFYSKLLLTDTPIKKKFKHLTICYLKLVRHEDNT